MEEAKSGWEAGGMNERDSGRKEGMRKGSVGGEARMDLVSVASPGHFLKQRLCEEP